MIEIDKKRNSFIIGVFHSFKMTSDGIPHFDSNNVYTERIFCFISILVSLFTIFGKDIFSIVAMDAEM